MPPEDFAMGSPAQWLAYALSDLEVAEGPAGDNVLASTLCFHAQQAVEKSLKAVLVHRGIGFPRTHNLGVLMDLLPADCSPPDSGGVTVHGWS
jgi:HEPN domain-containing protein